MSVPSSVHWSTNSPLENFVPRYSQFSHRFMDVKCVLGLCRFMKITPLRRILCRLLKTFHHKSGRLLYFVRTPQTITTAGHRRWRQLHTNPSIEPHNDVFPGYAVHSPALHLLAHVVFVILLLQHRRSMSYTNQSYFRHYQKQRSHSRHHRF